MKKRLLSFKYAFQGIATLVRTQPNFIIHIFATFVVIGGGFYFGLSATEWCLLVFAIGMVLSAEAFNSGLEFLTDLVSPEYNELAGKTKDVAAGGVLLAAMAAAIIGFIIFLPKIIELF